MKMFRRKSASEIFIEVVGALALVFVLMAMTIDFAYATGNHNNGDDQTQGQAQGQGQGQAQGQQVNVNIGGGAEGEGGPLATSAGGASTASGQATASNDGVTTNNSTNNNTRFFAFNSSIPAAGECFGAAQGGGGNGTGGGFLGINFLNKDCWYAKTAEFEESVEVRARLKCGSKAFRNAIAYEKPKRERQQACIGFMVRSMVEQLEFENAKAQEMFDAQTLLINDHVTQETVRTTDSVTRAVENCTDCFGTK